MMDNRPLESNLACLLDGRRSARSFAESIGVSLEDVRMLLWAAQGEVETLRGKLRRTAPSAGALYPLKVLVVARNVAGLAPGLYHYSTRSFTYQPEDYLEELHIPGGWQDDPDPTPGPQDGPVDRLMRELTKAALNQRAVAQAPVVFVFSASYERMSKYGKRGARYAHMEVGHAVQNLLLMATAQGLGACPIGAFHEGRVEDLLGLGAEDNALYLVPVGVPARG